jgi:hypothetical protein
MILESAVIEEGRSVLAGGKMVVLKRRSRLVTFRASAEEYEALVQSCIESGARSIADFARAAVLERTHIGQPRSSTLSGDLNTLGQTLGDLDAALVLARKRIRDVLGPSDDVDRIDHEDRESHGPDAPLLEDEDDDGR